MKKKAIILCACVLCLIATVMALAIHSTRVIGTVSGAEWEYLRIDDKTYQRDENAPVSGRDKERLLGTAQGGDKRIFIYSIKGSDEYLYARWEWEGYIYRKKMEDIASGLSNRNNQ